MPDLVSWPLRARVVGDEDERPAGCGSELTGPAALRKHHCGLFRRDRDFDTAAPMLIAEFLGAPSPPLRQEG